MAQIENQTIAILIIIFFLVGGGIMSILEYICYGYWNNGMDMMIIGFYVCIAFTISGLL